MGFEVYFARFVNLSWAWATGYYVDRRGADGVWGMQNLLKKGGASRFWKTAGGDAHGFFTSAPRGSRAEFSEHDGRLAGL